LPTDKDIQTNISLAVAFLKHYGEDFLGVTPKNKRDLVDLGEGPVSQPQVVLVHV
jgi:hypothetical protein